MSEQLRKLEALCTTISALDERVRRRVTAHDTEANAYADQQIISVITPLKGTLAEYRDFYKTHTNRTGQISFQYRDEFFTMVSKADDARLRLYDLAFNVLGRIQAGPGAAHKLTPFFKAIVTHERDVLTHAHEELKDILVVDLARLKRMPRHLKPVNPSNS